MTVKMLSVCAAACASMVAFATDLEDFFLRHEFVTGTQVASFGASSTLTSDPIGGGTPVVTYGQDGAHTAVNPGGAYKTDLFGDNDSSGTLNHTNWSVAASVRAPAVEGGVLFSTRRLTPTGYYDFIISRMGMAIFIR